MLSPAEGYGLVPFKNLTPKACLSDRIQGVVLDFVACVVVFTQSH